VRSLTWEQVRRRRLARGHLATRAPRDRLLDVVRAVCGVQAQVGGAAELAIAARVADATQADVRAELWKRRALVKTWTLRGTLHLHPADDVPLWTAAVRAADAEWYETEKGKAVLDAIAEALDGRCLLRSELAAEIERRVGPEAGEKVASGWAYLLGRAALAGGLCHGPPQGAKATFVRPDQWIGEWPEHNPSEAQVEACRRYLAAYGPATPRAFSEWLGLQIADARLLFDAIDLEEVDVEGRSAWWLRDDETPEVDRLQVRLLPEYDSYVMGFREREQLLPLEARSVLTKHPRGRFEGVAAVPTVLIDGRVAGLWRRWRRGKRFEIVVEMVRRLSANEQELLMEEAERIGAFLGAVPVLRQGSLSG
jgi:hypothetical protein